VPETPILGKIPKKGSKTRIPGSPGGGFTSTPRGGAPRFRRVSPGAPPTPRRVESLLAAPGLEGEWYGSLLAQLRGLTRDLSF